MRRCFCCFVRCRATRKNALVWRKRGQRGQKPEASACRRESGVVDAPFVWRRVKRAIDVLRISISSSFSLPSALFPFRSSSSSSSFSTNSSQPCRASLSPAGSGTSVSEDSGGKTQGQREKEEKDETDKKTLAPNRSFSSSLFRPFFSPLSPPPILERTMRSRPMPESASEHREPIPEVPKHVNCGPQFRIHLKLKAWPLETQPPLSQSFQPQRLLSTSTPLLSLKKTRLAHRPRPPRRGLLRHRLRQPRQLLP